MDHLGENPVTQTVKYIITRYLLYVPLIQKVQTYFNTLLSFMVGLNMYTSGNFESV